MYTVQCLKLRRMTCFVDCSVIPLIEPNYTITLFTDSKSSLLSLLSKYTVIYNQRMIYNNLLEGLGTTMTNAYLLGSSLQTT